MYFINRRNKKQKHLLYNMLKKHSKKTDEKIKKKKNIKTY